MYVCVCTLQVCELLIKLQRQAAPTHILLLHPRSHPRFVDYLLAQQRGVLRLNIHNQAR